MNEIVRAQDVNIAELQTTARLLAMSNYFDAKGNSDTAIAQIATKILAGRELGYGPFASVNGIHIIQGRPAVSANLMAAAVKSSGRYDYRVKAMSADVVTIEFYERTQDGRRELLGESTFTKDDAVKAGTQNLAKFARNMLFARAMSNGVKWFCPDVFSGNAVYVPEELGATVDGDGNVIDVQRTEVQPAQTTTQTPPVTVAVGQQPASSNGNGNGHGGIWQGWRTPTDAFAWAVDCGACTDTPGAVGSFNKIVKEQFGGKLTKANEPDVLKAFYNRQMDKLHERADAELPKVEEINPDGIEVPA